MSGHGPTGAEAGTGRRGAAVPGWAGLAGEGVGPPGRERGAGAEEMRPTLGNRWAAAQPG
jgi:hypothetical protein